MNVDKINTVLYGTTKKQIIINALCIGFVIGMIFTSFLYEYVY